MLVLRADLLVVQDEVRAGLAAALLPPELAAHVVETLPEYASGALLYGSWARGDATTDSDVDILVVAESRHAACHPPVSISCYTREELATFDRTLFGMHLARDGRILTDPFGVLSKFIGSLHPPDPEQLRTRVRELAVVLDPGGDDPELHLRGRVKVARYLLRTSLYASALASGRPCFSVRELADRSEDFDLVELLSSHESVHPEPSPEVLLDLQARISQVVGPLPANAYGSLHALIAVASRSSPDLARIGLLVLAAQEGADLPYDELGRVIL